MDKSKVDKALSECKRFIQSIETLPEAEKYGMEGRLKLFYRGGVATGAVRRASMDLTRALAELRKS